MLDCFQWVFNISIRGSCSLFSRGSCSLFSTREGHVLQTLFPKPSDGGRRTHSVSALLLVVIGGHRAHSASALLLVSDVGEMRRIGLVYFLYLFFYSGLEFTLTFLTHNRFSYDSMKQGRMFLFIGVVMILVQGETEGWG